MYIRPFGLGQIREVIFRKHDIAPSYTKHAIRSSQNHVLANSSHQVSNTAYSDVSTATLETSSRSNTPSLNFASLAVKQNRTRKTLCLAHLWYKSPFSSSDTPPSVQAPIMCGERGTTVMLVLPHGQRSRGRLIIPRRCLDYTINDCGPFVVSDDQPMDCTRESWLEP